MAYSSATWNQLKELTLEELAKALNGWTEERRSGRRSGSSRPPGNGGCQPTAGGAARASGKELWTPPSEGIA